MNINNGFVPCAGKGTRMGELSTLIAKPLWNIFDKTMLEVQTSFLKDYLGVDNVYINTHHLANQFTSHDTSKTLFEKSLLGSGGNIHNLKHTNEDLEKVIIINPDINLFLSLNDMKNLKIAFETHDYVMVCLPVIAGGDYNEVHATEQNFFSHVTGPNASKSYITYSGFGMINLAKVRYVEGESSFFESVISEESGCYIFTPSERYEYWDWGELKQYIQNIEVLAAKSHSSMLKKHLIKIGAFKEREAFDLSYRSKLKRCYNFSNNVDKESENSIIISNGNSDSYLIEI